MKKILMCLCLLIFLCTNAVAKCSQCSNHNCNYGNHHSSEHSSSSSSEHVYLTNTEHKTYEQKFPNCNEHYAITETTTNYYSNGTKNVFSNSTIYNSDGTVLETDCISVRHIIYDNKHYFIINKKGLGYKIIDDKANILTTKKYSRMTELEAGKFLVKYNKKYGIININEKTIVPIKYQQMEFLENNTFIVKLNGYYGVLDIDNNELITNDCDKIKQTNDVLIIKRYDKYGLADTQGKLIYDIKYEKIKKLGEYIIVKQNKKYGVYSPETNSKSKIMYKKITLERNKLVGIVGKNTEIKIEFPKE